MSCEGISYEDLKSGKVKLEFGNSRQIALIDKHWEMERLKEVEDDDEIEKIYEAEFAVSGTAIVHVTATNADDAKEEAKNTVWRPDVEDIDFDLLGIKLVGRACDGVVDC